MNIKVLTSPVKEPYWKFKAAGLDEKHFKEADAVHFTCSFKDKYGDKMFPGVYEMKSDIALSFCKRDEKNPKLVLVPFDQCRRVDL